MNNNKVNIFKPLITNLHKIYKEVYKSMQTLKEIYDDIANYPEKFKYYWDSENKLDLNKVWGEYPNEESNSEASNFINNYFEMGEKTISNIMAFNIRVNQSDRDIHTISVFTLGIAIAEKLGHPIKDNDLFVWFLMCLFHDKGYAFERSTNDTNVGANLPDTLDGFLRGFNDNYFEDFFQDDNEKDLYENYYKYRKQKCHVVDHGIVGGLLLYYVLVHNFYTLKDNINSFIINSDIFFYNGRIFKKNYFNDYKKAAKGIMRHNMWYASNEEDIQIYQDCNLKGLISSGDNKISFEEDKLLFLLCLSDTIEPLKKTLNVNFSDTLSKISMEVSEGVLILQIKKDFRKIDEYIQSIKDLEVWMNVKYKIEKNDKKDDNKITVSIKCQLMECSQ